MREKGARVVDYGGRLDRSSEEVVLREYIAGGSGSRKGISRSGLWCMSVLRTNGLRKLRTSSSRKESKVSLLN